MNDVKYIAHHGIKGQKWYVRRYQNEDGTLTEEGKKRYGYVNGHVYNKDRMTKDVIKTFNFEDENRAVQEGHIANDKLTDAQYLFWHNKIMDTMATQASLVQMIKDYDLPITSKTVKRMSGYSEGQKKFNKTMAFLGGMPVSLIVNAINNEKIEGIKLERKK